MWVMPRQDVAFLVGLPLRTSRFRFSLYKHIRMFINIDQAFKKRENIFWFLAHPIIDWIETWGSDEVWMLIH